MDPYTCQRCRKKFDNEDKYTKHINRKRLCIEREVKIIKPILKWVGGKAKILDKILCKFPKNIDNYHEIFLGGGSVLFGLLHSINNGSIKVSGKVYAYDLNEPLIYVYKNIQGDRESLFSTIENMINEYSSYNDDGDVNRAPKNIDNVNSKESYYYLIRGRYNALTKEEKCDIKGSAMFIFLNKTCFRGMFRISNKGLFNVPYGHYSSPEILNRAHLEEVYSLIKDVHFICMDFTQSMNNGNKGDLLYLDPPYAPENSSSFVSYTEGGFNDDMHKTLFMLCNNINIRGINLLMNNSDVELVRDSFKSKNYRIESISCRRSINPKRPDSTTDEVIITNY